MTRIILEECHFEYGDFVSRNYGLIFAHVDTSEFKSLAGEIQVNTIFNKRNNRNYLISNDYEDSPMSFDVEIVTDNPYPLTDRERREIERRLFYQRDYRKLYVDAQDDCAGLTTELIGGVRKRLYLNCRFIDPERIENGAGDTVGYKCTAECDSFMSYQDEIEVEEALSNDSEESVSYVKIYLDTDTKEYTYPKVTFETGAQAGDYAGNVTIINQTDDPSRLTSFTAIPRAASVTMNGELNYISGEHYSRFSNKNFIRLLDGENIISVQGNVSKITFVWQNRRYM